jgi:glycosyltransferase involved in cell wall biosynthesis
MKQPLHILCFSTTDWDGVWGSRQQVMLRFAGRGYRVVFIEQSAGLEHFARYPDLLRRKLHRWREGMREVSPNLWIYSLPPLIPGRYYSLWVNNSNQTLTAFWVRRILRRLNARPALLWLYAPELAPLLGRFGERLSVYHCIDEHAAETAGRKRRVLTAMEETLLRGADIVFANSRAIYDKKRSHNPNTHRVPSGADVVHFSRGLDGSLPVHPAIATIPQPRIGYIGNINERLDYAVLDHLASRHPEWSIVLVGDTYPWTMRAPALKRMLALPNVHFLGKHPFADMPAIVKGMSVCMLPYVEDERAHYRSPLKLYEYLAAGKPVVALRHPEVKIIERAVYVAATPEEFASSVSAALEDIDPQQASERVLIAKAHSWDIRVDDMERVIHESLKE